MDCKRDFVPRYKAGEFGNASPTWDNFEEWINDISANDTLRYHIRNRVAGGPTYYDLPWIRVYAKWTELVESGVSPESLYISAMAPHWANLVQGEAMQSERHLSLLYSTAPNLPMRDALAQESRRAEGLQAVGILKAYLCPNSLEWLNQLLDGYPSHVIEFSTFSVCWGTVPNYNSVFWEVRRY